ncbi:hypothetical protein P9112_012511 [Eukaryota sp. TZLM1-RC]
MASLQALKEIFPTVEDDVIISVLEQCSNNTDLAVVALLQLTDDTFSDNVFPTRSDEQLQVQRDEAYAAALQRQILHESMGYNGGYTNPAVTDELRNRLPGTGIGQKLGVAAKSTVRGFKKLAGKLRPTGSYERVGDDQDDVADDGIALSNTNQPNSEMSELPSVPSLRRRHAEREEDDLLDVELPSFSSKNR